MCAHGSTHRPAPRRYFPSLVTSIAFFLSVAAHAQIICVNNAGVPPTVRLPANAEYAANIVINCSGDGSTGFAEFRIDFNVPVTSNIVNTATGETEALLML